MEWLVLRGRDGGVQLAFQQVDELRASTWPAHEVPQQLHLDTVVSTAEELAEVHERALSLGAQVLLDRTDDPDEPLWVYADPRRSPVLRVRGLKPDGAGPPSQRPPPRSQPHGHDSRTQAVRAPQVDRGAAEHGPTVAPTS